MRRAFPRRFSLSAGAIFAILSLITAGSGVKPRHELKPIRGMERIAIAGALLAVFAIHASGLLWASARLEDMRAFQRMSARTQLAGCGALAFLLGSEGAAPDFDQSPSGDAFAAWIGAACQSIRRDRDAVQAGILIADACVL